MGFHEVSVFKEDAMNNTKDYDPNFTRFHDLMKFRVREILLVSTPYDSFVLEEDGHLSDKIFSEYLDLNLQFVPRITHASSGAEALDELKNRTYDLVITMPRINDMTSLEFSRLVKEAYPDKPVVMLTYETLDSETLKTIREAKTIDRVFVWSGNSQILLAIIKYVEDKGNLEDDIKQGVQVILVVDDTPSYYSQFLPLIYTEIMKQTRYLISHAVNDFHRLLRMRARPKIILAISYEEAMEFSHKYQNNLLGIISDIGFLKEKEVYSEAGLELAAEVGKRIPDLPILLHSEETQNVEKAKKIGMRFLDKNSPNLLKELRSYILENYSFGEFVFKNSMGEVLSKTSDLSSFERVLKSLPDESLIYHACHHHFSRWFRARTEFEVADELRFRENNAYENPEEFRKTMIECLDKIFRGYQKGVIVDFGSAKMDLENSFVRIGTGSLGGKARGVAFFRSFLMKGELQKKYPDIKLKIPSSFVICGDVFEEFMVANDLQDMATSSVNEDEIATNFLNAQLPSVVVRDLKILVEEVDYPLAVRSSSILEDSQVLPFAGIFKTYVIPNCDLSVEGRLKQLLDAVKLIYASAFFQSPKGYAKNADVRIEEGSMSILIQQLVGERHGDIFYPVISGVAQTYNYYPYSYMQPDQGIVNLALGFGKSIVDGGRVYSFSPAYPKLNPPYANPRELMDNTQSKFFALDLSDPSKQLIADDDCTYVQMGLDRAAQDGTLQKICSTYLAENDYVMDSYAENGPKIVTFAPVLKYNTFPLVGIIKDLFDMAKKAFGADVEIEFAVNLPVESEGLPEFYFLQIRPMVVGREASEVRIEDAREEDVLCTSGHIIGNGVYQNISHIIYVDPDTFEIAKTPAIATEIGELNKILAEKDEKCVLMGFGRIGTSEQWLGIPLAWWQMSQAKIVVEADLGNLIVEPSLGSHFHHNLTSLKMGYFHIGQKKDEGDLIHWDNMRKGEVVKETAHAKLIRFPEPLVIKINGQNGKGVILTKEAMVKLEEGGEE